MKRLDFGSYSSTEWEEFELQPGARRYKRTPDRRGERNGTRMRTYEIKAGRIADLVIPRARKLDIRFTVFEL